MPRPLAPIAVVRPLAGAAVCARELPRFEGAMIAAWAFTPAAG